MMRVNDINEELDKLKYQFKDYIISERNLSINTVDSYNRDISQFINYLISLNKQSVECLFTLDTLDSYLVQLDTKAITSRSILRKLSSISLFLKFLKIEGIIKDNPSYLLNRPKIIQKLPFYLTVEEVEDFINSFDLSKPEGIRDRALFELIYSCGLRVSEVSTLNVGSIYFEESIVQVFGKGRKERYVPLGEIAKQEVLRYLRDARPLLEKSSKPSNALFLNFRGDRLTRKGIWKNLKIASIKVGIDVSKFTVHTLRHSFATHLIQNGADIRGVQELLGHKNINTTEIYTHLKTSHLKDAYYKYHSHK